MDELFFVSDVGEPKALNRLPPARVTPVSVLSLIKSLLLFFIDVCLMIVPTADA
jgi:hypothetical protein